MKRLFTLIFALILSSTATAQQLKFRGDSTFKIAQFTDVHFKSGAPESQVSLELFREVIETQSPDLVVLSGDIVVEPAPVKDGWRAVLAPFQEAGIPVAITLGNHDDEHDLSRSELYRLLKSQEGCYCQPGHYSLAIKGTNGKSAAIVYLFDSGSYSTNDNVEGYGWITHSGVQSYIEASQRYTKRNGGEPLPALAYFHIPLPEHREAYENRESPAVGNRGEEECAPEINTGLFAAMVEAGDVMGCFVGHDHVNDYTAYKNGIALGYGRVSSEGTTYGDLRAGCRIVTLTQGKRNFQSYIYQRGGAITQRSTYPKTLRFAVTSDTHFDPAPETDQWVNVVELNKLELDGVAIVGDIFDHQSPSVIEHFRRRYENSGIDSDSTLRTEVYLGMGNHDIKPVENDSIQNLIEQSLTLEYIDSLLYAQKSDGRVLNLHPATRNHSFNLSGLHFIQTNTWAGDSTLGSGGLEWLAEDLRRYGANGEPIVLLMHYTFNPKSTRWINMEQREALLQVLEGYNIKAIFNGHDHFAQHSKWEGYDVYQCDNTWIDNPETLPSFWVIEYQQGGEFNVKKHHWQGTYR